MLLATPVHPPSFSTQHGSEDSSQYRPSQDFKSLLPPIEFVEGSSSGGLAVPEGKYEPINGTPKALKVNGNDNTKNTRMTPFQSTTAPAAPSPKGKNTTSLYTGVLDTTWPHASRVGAGLYNNGNTCFLNSALQCLLHTPPLLRVLIAHGQSDPCRASDHFCMSCSLRNVMVESYSRRTPFLPTAITSKLQTIAKHMRKGRQEDTHEFLRYAIDALQKSCLAGLPPKIDAKLAETTWVHKIFGGRLRSRVTCRECHYNSDTFDSILDLSLDIFRQNSVKEALHTFGKVDHLKGADKYKCEKCKKPVNAEKQFTIHDAPVVLTVHFKRFTPIGRKLAQPIKYDERLSLQPVMSDGQYGPSYSLYGVICHAGGGPNSGHYYGYVKSANGQWYEMNDESVSPSRAPVGLKSAYMLFYIRDKGQALEAAVSRASIPQRNGVAAGMKKRKTADSDDEKEREDTGVKTVRPFIGPQLPSPTPSGVPNHPNANAIDPQAEVIKKKIAAASKAKAAQALHDLSLYADEEEEEGEKGSSKEGDPSNGQENLTPSTNGTPSSPPPGPSASSPVSSLSIPTGNFYNTSNGQVEKGKKRKSPDDDTDENKQSPSDQAHKPLYNSPGLTSSSPRFKHRKKSSFGSGNPFNRVRGANNLHQKDSISHRPPQITYKKKRTFMI